jgi:Na+/H+-dicarboxylate symporter
MSTSTGGQAAYQQTPSNGMGTAGFVCGLVGLVFSFIPIIGLIAWPLVIIGLVLSAIGMSHANKGRATNKGLATAGLVVSVIGLAICIIWVAALGHN